MWILLFAPKPARQAVWSEVVRELSYPVNSTSTEQVTADTVSLLTAIELQKWKKKLKAVFGSQGIGVGRQLVARAVGEKVNPTNVPLPQTRKKMTKNGFASGEQSSYYQNSHMSLRDQLINNDDCSWDNEDDLFDLSTELAQQIRELTEMEVLDSITRIELLQHRPYAQITPFLVVARICLLDEKNPISTKRVVRCVQLSLRDGAVHWHRALSRKTKQTWSLSSDKFSCYYYSQFSQLASTQYYRTKRMEKEHIRDCLDRLNGYARNANIRFANGGPCETFPGDLRHKDRERQLTMQLRDIYTFEDVVSDIIKVEKRVSSRESSKYSSRKDESRNAYGRSDNRNRTPGRSCSEPRSTRVALADAILSNLISELQEEIPVCADETIGYEQNQSDVDHCLEEVQIEGPMLQKVKELSLLRTTMNVELQLMELLLDVISVHNKVEHFQVDLIKAVIDLTLDKIYGSVIVEADRVSRKISMDHVLPGVVSIIQPLLLPAMQILPAGPCEAFNELAKILRIIVNKSDISPELKKLPPPQSVERVIDADCIYAFISKCNYPDEGYEYCMNTTGLETERGISLGGFKNGSEDHSGR
ncbi:Eukaryotic/viral aspartic protease [Phytophthora megakarya]|uniref:Eukaryotic/viral aspartic protease n=1 Tax=Phytophthora megakarya TaxID=4795 RepID=A0A225WRM1_9STRA|nr:Eukaryotic/viral aspartic protease [Phytophthora megakarya]